ncbi:cyclic-di-AMP-binding protein CbpB [Fervidibacillus halotolerans]|uniref:CBS domain-containing protein n=1 Tax=Fervidibacillus halotolerans TaxID=2980027 RepID=A0A9E8M0Q2_9BACI|nr:cyclic-di-AMP-binding protein CbpB [Fervidibacillus halotolerans]WAA13227.1 CBS domain-containing protein [Fervidibacillus halotolerans]
MIDLQKDVLMEKRIGDLLVPSERVAHVQIGNNLEHALLVLTKSGYTAIPVLDPKYKLHGLISSPLILDSILGIERIEFEKLENIPVEQVMKKDIPKLHVNDSLNKGLKLLINHPFICAVDKDGYFEGILTRRIVLKQLSGLLHRLDIQFLD